MTMKLTSFRLDELPDATEPALTPSVRGNLMIPRSAPRRVRLKLELTPNAGSSETEDLGPVTLRIDCKACRVGDMKTEQLVDELAHMLSRVLAGR